jgi:diguanylate cyclase (GGDEF)-like protein
VVREYCGEGTSGATPATLAKVVVAVQELAVSRGSLSISDALAAPELETAREAVAELSISSLLVLPLSDGKDQVGVLMLTQMLTQSTARVWQSNEVLVLRTIGEQIVIALNNAGLRRLVKNLSVTDEQSGLLKRASYLDLLLSETRRAQQQGTPLTVLLMQLGKSSTMVKEYGETAVEAAMQQTGQLFSANIRQNDLAFRYEMTTVALVLGETGHKEAKATAEKLRKLLGEVRLPGRDEPLPFNVGLAEAVVRQDFDAVDIVTEVINRAEQALDTSIAQGAGKLVTVAATLTAAATA